MAVMSFSSTEQVLAVLEAGPPTLETDARQQLSAQRSEQQLFATSPALGQLSAQRSEAFAERAATPVCNTVALEQPSAQRARSSSSSPSARRRRQRSSSSSLCSARSRSCTPSMRRRPRRRRPQPCRVVLSRHVTRGGFSSATLSLLCRWGERYGTAATYLGPLEICNATSTRSACSKLNASKHPPINAAHWVSQQQLAVLLTALTPRSARRSRRSPSARRRRCVS